MLLYQNRYTNAVACTSTLNLNYIVYIYYVYCCRNEFAHASSDKMVYIRRFSVKGVEMVLLNTLQGHFGEVMCVRWNHITECWVTGSEDSTVRIWASGHGHGGMHRHAWVYTGMHGQQGMHRQAQTCICTGIHTQVHINSTNLEKNMQKCRKIPK